MSSSDVRVVYVSSDDTLARLDAQADLNRVVGHVALVDLAPGTLLTRRSSPTACARQAGDGIVGLSLDPGGYPAMWTVAGRPRERGPNRRPRRPVARLTSTR
jgi:hypothetical protein